MERMKRMGAGQSEAAVKTATGKKIDTPQDDLTYRIIGLAMAVHNALGPGFPEEVYHRALEVSLQADGLPYEREVRVNVMYRDQVVGTFDLDLVVGNSVIVELKALSASFAPIHQQQVIAYLAASGLPIALLINFGMSRLQYKRLFPPLSVQASPAYQARQALLK
jgi:GxxExxY protein